MATNIQVVTNISAAETTYEHAQILIHLPVWTLIFLKECYRSGHFSSLIFSRISNDVIKTDGI